VPVPRLFPAGYLLETTAWYLPGRGRDMVVLSRFQPIRRRSLSVDIEKMVVDG
jgi:hypothetical protein